MPITCCTTGCYWTTSGRLWMALEDGTAVLTGLHDLRFLPLYWTLLDRTPKAGKSPSNGGTRGWSLTEVGVTDASTPAEAVLVCYSSSSKPDFSARSTQSDRSCNPSFSFKRAR